MARPISAGAVRCGLVNGTGMIKLLGIVLLLPSAWREPRNRAATRKTHQFALGAVRSGLRVSFVWLPFSGWRLCHPRRWSPASTVGGAVDPSSMFPASFRDFHPRSMLVGWSARRTTRVQRH
jgi:hypothetical protein